MRIASILLLSAALLLSGCAKSQPAEHGAHGGSHEAGGKEQVQAVFGVKSSGGQTAAKAQDDTPLTIQIQDAAGKPVNEFDLNHEKMMHLIVVSKDLSYFNHIHPEYQGKGLFTVTTRFPAGGDYKLFADFAPSGKEKSVLSHALTVQGNAASPAGLKPDAKLTATVNGTEVALAIDGLKAGAEANLTYTFKDAATKAPVQNLQPYLGAVGHVVILDAAAEQYLHVHPTDEKSTGPSAKFMTTFPQSGIYKIWGEFQRDGQVFAVPFVVKVP
ncbi:hypothetical protein ACFPES_34710 [Paenibacillus sp. GCM10023248]|uniref:hypothetical protein n=1 Tax=Bacillales TaxID=1385 RepID=UPI002379DB4E|nr:MULTISPECIES: hypothetical protein [Bacillales]MDD9272183.1 hypothetical protein [Paenibacillus sp. MAHUQ-63]MDR6885353.1 hypothetical protein [Bacillus sp. 3255]